MVILMLNLPFLLAKGKISRAIEVHTRVDPLSIPHFGTVEMARIGPKIERTIGVHARGMTLSAPVVGTFETLRCIRWRDWEG
jgi:hypothetical protein